MSTPQPEHPDHVPEVLAASHLWSSLRARWVLLLIGPLLGAAVGLGLAGVLPTQYNAVATVRAGDGIVPVASLGRSTEGALTESQLATLQPQLETIAEELGTSATLVKEHLNVAARSGTPLIDFTFSAASPRAAEHGADVATEVYLKASSSSAAAQIQERIGLLQTELATASVEIRPALLADLSTLQRTVVDQGVVVRDAAGSAERSLLVPPLYVAIGGLGGLLLAALLAMLLESWRPRMRRGTRLSGLPTLGHFTSRMDPQDARRMLMPALVRAGEDTLDLVPLGDSADSLAELFSRSIRGISWIDPGGDGLSRAPGGGPLVALIRVGTPVRQVRALASRLAMVRAPLLGVVLAEPRALRMAEKVLDAEHEELAGQRS